MSPQSFQPSHFRSLLMQMPVEQANMSGQAAHQTRGKREGAEKKKDEKKGDIDGDDELSERE